MIQQINPIHRLFLRLFPPPARAIVERPTSIAYVNHGVPAVADTRAVDRVRAYGRVLETVLNNVLELDPRAPQALTFYDWSIMGDRHIGYHLNPLRLHHLPLRALASDDLTTQMALAIRKPVKFFQSPTAGIGYAVEMKPKADALSAPAAINLPTLIDLPDYARPAGVLPTAIGVSGDGQIVIDLSQPNHILIGGLTQHGKTGLVYNLLIGACRFAAPDQLRVALVDPKGQFVNFQHLPHLLAPIATDANAALKTVRGIIAQIEERRNIFKQVEAIDLDHYNERCAAFGLRPLPHVLLIIDDGVEMGLTAGKSWMPMLTRIASISASYGVRLVFISTSVTADVIDTSFRRMFSIRLSVRCTENQQSDTILGDKIYAAAKLPDVQGRFAANFPDRGVVIGQGYYLSRRMLAACADQLAGDASPSATVDPTLTQQQREWVVFALRSPLCRDKRTGLACFNLRRVSDEFDVRVKDLMSIAAEWQARGWLLPKPRSDASRPISQILRDLVGWVEKEAA